MPTETRERWFVLGTVSGTSEKTLQYVCAVPVSEYGVSVPETLNLTHALRPVPVNVLREAVFAEKDVLTGRVKGDPQILRGQQELEEGSPLHLVLKSKQDKKTWDNLDNLPTFDDVVEGINVRITKVE